MNQIQPKEIGMIRLDEGARRRGWHVETLRRRGRDGRLTSPRRPHGAYYAKEQDLAELPSPPPGGPPQRKVARAEREGSLEIVDAMLRPAKEWASRELALVAELRLSPATNLRLFRLISVHSLRRLGLAFEDIGEELGISARHARRLFGRRVFIALRRHLMTEDRALARRERELAWRESRLGRRRGRRWARRVGSTG